MVSKEHTERGLHFLRVCLKAFESTWLRTLDVGSFRIVWADTWKWDPLHPALCIQQIYLGFNLRWEEGPAGPASSPWGTAMEGNHLSPCLEPLLCDLLREHGAAPSLAFVSAFPWIMRLVYDFLLFFFYRLCNPCAGDKHVNTIPHLQRSQMFWWNPTITTSSFSVWVLMSRFTGRFYKSDVRCRIIPPAMWFSESKPQRNHNRQDDWLNNPFLFFLSLRQTMLQLCIFIPLIKELQQKWNSQRLPRPAFKVGSPVPPVWLCNGRTPAVLDH